MKKTKNIKEKENILSEQQLRTMARVAEESVAYPVLTRAVSSSRRDWSAGSRPRTAGNPPNLKQRQAKPGTI